MANSKLLTRKTGTQERNRKEFGRMVYTNKARNDAVELGLPKVVYGQPLGCGCREAYLSSVSPIVDGTVEANYKCRSSWNNYFVFELEQEEQTKPGKTLKVNQWGEVTEGDDGFKAEKLEEY